MLSLDWNIKKKSMHKRTKSFISRHSVTFKRHKWTIGFICFWIVMILYFYLNSGPSVSVLSSNNRSSYCSEYQHHETNPIHDICSFAHYLGLNEWTNRQCHFKHPVEGHWLIGSLMTWWYGLTKQQHCDTINVHRFLQKGPIKQNEREIIDEDQFTILINTWRRNECLIDSVEHYLRCPAVAQMRII